MVREAVEPGELVIELRPRSRIAIRRVHVPDPDCRGRSLAVPASVAVGIVWQAAARFVKVANPAEQCDAVPAFLPVPYRRITGLSDRIGREFVVRRLQLLQPDNIGL